MKTVYLIYGTGPSEPWCEYLLKIVDTAAKRDQLIPEFSKTWKNVRYEAWQVE